MSSIITYLVEIIQYQYQQICWLILFICKYIPLKQWAHDEVHSPKYQKFTVDPLPIIKTFFKQDWRFLQEYYLFKYGKKVKPVKRHKGKAIPDNKICPFCDAPHQYIYDNNGGRGQYHCKICDHKFCTGESATAPIRLLCPYCEHSLVFKKDRTFFKIHKCVNKKCPFYLKNLKKVGKEHLLEPYGKNKYKLHYIYREFTVDFFRMDLNSLPKNASSLKFTKHNAHVMSLCLTMHVNLQLSLRKTAQAIFELYGYSISHQQVANYARTAALVIKPFVDNYNYKRSDTYVADETYIKIRGVWRYLWLIIDAASRSIIGYQVSDNRSVGPCILAMRMAFRHLQKLPEYFRFIADGYSAYPLAAQQFFHEFGEAFKFEVTQVLGLTNDDAVSKEFRPYKQMIERLNRTFNDSYRITCGYDNLEGANYNVTLWVAYYNFLRPHKAKGGDVLNKLELLEDESKKGNMPGKWQMLILLGQKTILNMQQSSSESAA